MMEEIRLRINEMILHGKEEPELDDGVSPRESPAPTSAPGNGTGDVPTIRVDEGSNNASAASSPHPGATSSGSHHLNPTAPAFRPGSSSSSPISSPAGGNKAMLLSNLASSQNQNHHSLLRAHTGSNTHPPVSSPLSLTPIPGNGVGSNDDDDDDGPEDGEDTGDDEGSDRRRTRRVRNGGDGDVEMGEVSDRSPHGYSTRGPSSSSSGNSGNGSGSGGGANGGTPKKRERAHVAKEDLEEGETSDASSDLSSIPEDRQIL